MENVKIILENNTESYVKGLFYIYNSKYYFIYTLRELDENEYVKLYVVQVCKEVKNTPTGPVDTGFMLGMQISDPEEWKKVQTSITKIVDDKKNGTQNSEIQYLPISMLVNLKIVSNNKFKLMRQIIEDNFNIKLETTVNENQIENTVASLPSMTQGVEISIDQQVIQPQSVQPMEQQTTQIQPVELRELDINGNIANESEPSAEIQTNDIMTNNDVIIDYRARFFEEQEKNKILEEEIKRLNEKLNSIRNVIG